MDLLDVFIDAIQNTNLNIVTKRHYISTLDKLQRTLDKPLAWIITHPNVTMHKWDTSPDIPKTSIRTYITAILACFKYVPNLQKKYSKARMTWMECFKKVDKVVQEKYTTRTPSQRQIDTYVSWDHIVSERDKLDKDSDEYLVLSMYTMIPPVRADYNRVRIYSAIDNDIKEPNYLVVTPKKMTLVLTEFKSKSKKLQKYEHDLPSNLQSVIRKSLKLRPRDYLIVSPRTGRPYDNPTSYDVYVNRIFGKVIGKGVTINTFRHSYINSLDLNNMSVQDMEHTAQKLLHSRDTMLRYRLAIPARDSLDRRPRICTVTCKSQVLDNT